MSKKTIFFLVGILCLLTSCFEIVEEIDINDDGTGSFNYTINLSQSKSKLASIILMDSINGYKVPTEKVIRENIDYLQKNVSQIEGIKEVQTKLDFNEFIFTLSCNFSNVTSLNKLIVQVEKMSGNKEPISTDSVHFSWNGKSFERYHNFNAAPLYGRLKEIDKKVFEGAFYRSIQRFQRPISGSSNALSKVSKSKKAIMIQIPVRDLLLNQAPIKNKITL